MKTRVFFLALFIVGAVIGGYYFMAFLSSYSFIWPTIDARFVALLILGTVLQLVAHWVRAYKSKILLEPIRDSKTATLFKGLSVGYLFNLLLPFRAGELIRAYYVGDSLSLSKTTVFMSIIIERIVDGLILGVCFLITGMAIYPISSDASFLMLQFGLGVVFITFILTTLIYLARSENRHALNGIYSVTSIFNRTIADKMRLMAWSGIHGTKLMLIRQDLVVRYLVISLFMWLIYFASVASIVLAFFSGIGFTKVWYTIQSTYAGVTAPSGPGYVGTFQLITTKLLDLIGLPNASSFAFVNWIVLMAPIALIGVVILAVRRFTPYSQNTTREALINKLYRESDISKEFSYFMESYFKGEKINQILSNAELEDKFKLVRSFKGGSNAHTMLVWQDDELRVKKITLPQYTEKLKSQADWLIERKRIPHLPRVVAEEHDPEYYSFDLKFQEDFYPFFEFIHKNTTSQNFKVVKNMLAFMDKSIYMNAKETTSKKNLTSYIDGKVLGKINDTSLVSEEISRLLGYKTIRVNGVIYDNLLQVVEKIQKHKNATDELSNYRESAIHGDLTVDNLIVSSKGDFMVIDPNNENQVSAPVVDFGKLYQSLDSGYEFLIQLEQCTVADNKIDFEDSTSHKYADLFRKVDELLKDKLTPAEYRAILFHEAVHYCRMLTYRVSINEATVPVFYATAVKLFNEYLSQYDA